MEKKELTILGLTNNRIVRSGSQETYLLLLLEKESGLRISIIIGGNEAQAIIIATTNIEPPRPFTHDTFYNVLLCYGIEMKECYIYQVKEDIFYAEMVCEQNGEIKHFDTRASDAIAMALRFSVPIFTNEEVLEKAGISPNLADKKKEPEEMTPEEIKKALEEAVNKEDYETAAMLRDKMKEMKE